MTIEIQHWKWNRVFTRWEMLRRTCYEPRPAVAEFVRVWPALLEKRQQSTVLRPGPLTARIGHAYGSEV